MNAVTPIAGDEVAAESCPICDSRRTRLRYPANIDPSVPLAGAEFACTSPHLNRHAAIRHCAVCGIVFADPPGTETAVIETYQSAVDPTYLEELDYRRGLFRAQLAELERLERPGRLLEIGSNIGLFLDEAGRRGWRARGVEPSRWAVEYGRRSFGVDLQAGTLQDVDLGGEQFDAVVLWDVLEHLVDPVDVLRQARRHLRPGGVLMLTTVNIGGLSARLLRGRWPWLMRMHLFYFTRRTLAMVVRRAGYTPLAFHTQGRTLRLNYLLARLRTFSPLFGLLHTASRRLGLGGLPLRVNTGDILVAVALKPDGGE